MSQDITDSEFLAHTTAGADPADFIRMLVEDGGLVPFELQGSDGLAATIGDRLVIGKIPGPNASPDYGDIVPLAEGEVPNNGANSKWVVTIQVSIRQEPPTP